MSSRGRPKVSQKGEKKGADAAKVEDKLRPRRESSRTRAVKSYYEEVVVKQRTRSPARKRSVGRKKSLDRTQDEEVTSTEKRPSRRVSVKAPEKSHSPTWKSPARKSPSRRSPGRKSPSRISPARIKTEAELKATILHTSTPRQDIDTESDSDYQPVKPVKRRTPLKESRESSLKEFFISKRATTLTTEHITHVPDSYAQKKLIEFSDEDELPPVKRIDSIESRPTQSVFVTEYGGLFGAIFLILFIPIFAIGLHIFCNEKRCGYALPKLELYKFYALFNLFSILCFSAYFILLMLLSAIPYGGQKIVGNLSKYGRTSYVSNGWIMTLILHLTLIGLEFYGIKVINYVYENYFLLTVAALIHAISLSILLYVKSFFVPISALNPNGDTNSVIYNFFVGREVSPMLFGVINVKILLLRLTFITAALLTTVVTVTSLNLSVPDVLNLDFKGININTTLLTLSAMFYIYFLNEIVSLEKAWSSTFEMQYEGTGYLCCVGFSLIPWLCVTPLKYINDHNITLNVWILTLAFIQFLIGFFVYTASIRQKYLFRKNPYGPAVSHLQTIPTSQGKKLIASGYWGFVRHPNYLGDIIMHLSFFYFVYDVPLGLLCLSTIPGLMNRAKRDGFRCKLKYETSWDRYCQRVKYMIVPKVY